MQMPERCVMLCDAKSEEILQGQAGVWWEICEKSAG